MCGNILGGGVKWTLNKSQHTKLILEKRILPLLLPRFELATFGSQVWHSNQQVSWLLTSYPGSPHTLPLKHHTPEKHTTHTHTPEQINPQKNTDKRQMNKQASRQNLQSSASISLSLSSGVINVVKTLRSAICCRSSRSVP